MRCGLTIIFKAIARRTLILYEWISKFFHSSGTKGDGKRIASLLCILWGRYFEWATLRLPFYSFFFFFFFSKKKNSFSASREANVTQSTGNGSGGRTKETFWMHPSAEYPVADELTNVALWPHIFPNSILMFFFIYLLFFRRVSNILNFNATDMPESHNCVLNVKWNVTLRAIWFMFLTMVSYSDARLQFTE